MYYYQKGLKFMNIDPIKTIKKIEELLSASTPNDLSKLKKSIRTNTSFTKSIIIYNV